MSTKLDSATQIIEKAYTRATVNALRCLFIGAVLISLGLWILFGITAVGISLIVVGIVFLFAMSSFYSDSENLKRLMSDGD